jgi:glycyl-tRNA synthetase beta chain
MNTNSETILNNTGTLLMELGTEEIPARFLTNALTSLKSIAENVFSDNRLPYAEIKTYATPRRLVLMAEVGKRQVAVEKEMWGPPVSVAFDENGNPTKAADAFAKTHGISISELHRKQKGKGLYIVAVIKEGIKEASDILPEVLKKIIFSLSFPKNMRWGEGDLRFVRPIHWVLAIYNNEKVSFEIEGITSNVMTRGHRFLSPASFEIKDPKSYKHLLKNNYVIVDYEERKKLIIEGANKLAAEVNGTVIWDEDLLEHVTFLVEYPVPVLGTFSSEYLVLPQELLVTVMKGHQKYFALEDSRKRLINNFIIISNTKSANADTVRKGAERVIKARFEDARFYFEEDSKTALKSRVEALKNVVYHDRLGSLYSKTQRIASIAGSICTRSCPERQDDVNTAALLSKTDLITGVVREFPELQGIIGSYYASNEGYKESVSKALREQYLPSHTGDLLPETDTGAIVSISDKLDNIASFFMLGLSPTGSEDPFALRRQSHGVILIAMQKGYDLSLEKMLDIALEPYDVKGKSELMNSLLRFFEQRIDYILQSQGYPGDIIAAIMPFAWTTPLCRIKERMNALIEFKDDPDFDSLLLSIKRINNIAPKSVPAPARKDLFVQEEERLLYKDFESVSHEINSQLETHNYPNTLKALKTLKDSINNFFDKVLVMDKNEEIKMNRLAIIKDIQTLAMRIADFSKIT